MKTINFFKFTMTAISCIVVLALTACSDDDDKTPQLKFSANKIEMTAGNDSVVIVKGGTAPYTATSTNTEIATATTKGDSIIIAAVCAPSSPQGDIIDNRGQGHNHTVTQQMERKNG